MFKSGEFVSDYVTQVDGSKVPEKQVKPHGVELTIDKVWRLTDYCVIADDMYNKAPRREATIVDEGKYVDKSNSLNHSRKTVVSEENVEEDSLEKRLPSDNEYIELDSKHYVLTAGPHVVRYNEKISIPDKHVGFVWPRSRLIRNNNHLSSAVWDSGYEGRGEGGLHINTMTFLEKDMRIGQFVMCRASTMQQYDGSHQGENLNEDDE